MNGNIIIAKNAGGTRDSGIDLLKIIAIFIIIISHVTITVISNYAGSPYSDYIIDVNHASLDLTIITLVNLRHFTVIGNSIFFICSAWFLLDSRTSNKKKWFLKLTEIWLVSVTILIICETILRGDISTKIVIKSILPSLFSNNWYMTCYLLFILFIL